jgi:pSer/pThr/pTyr-binding forkhead associated (FHA) protein
MQDPTISSRHAALVIDAASGSIGVEDTGSTNGTFVNDEHIGFNGRRDLRDGDRLRFGGFSAVVKVIGRV